MVGQETRKDAPLPDGGEAAKRRALLEGKGIVSLATYIIYPASTCGLRYQSNWHINAGTGSQCLHCHPYLPLDPHAD